MFRPLFLFAGSFFSVATGVSSAHSNVPIYQDVLAASGLLGSHFGVPGLPASYDYVVLGGGTAGLTIARRLAADPANTVAVIEAGGFYEEDNGNYTQIPGDAVYFIEAEPKVRNPLIDWYQFTTPQKGFGGRSVHYPSGKTLGGGSARNFMWYQRWATSSGIRFAMQVRVNRVIRSATGAYQKWAHQVGDESYTLPNLDQYFKRSMHFFPPVSSLRPKNATVTFPESELESGTGPLSIAYPYWVNTISSFFADALSTLGLERVLSFADGNLLGYSYIPHTLTPDQVRSSSETSYLREAFERTLNLDVYKSTLAKRILFDDKKQATAVEVSTGGFTYQINATKEVIVSAGAFRSPQLLMVSGIGSEETLSKHGIKCLSNLPGVGQNMGDHVLVGQAYAVDFLTHSALTSNPAFLRQSVGQYNELRAGILTNPGADLLAFEKLPKGSLSTSTENDLAKNGPDWPDVEYVPFDNNLVSLATDTRNYVTSLAALVAPFSRGNVTISSNDTNDLPIVSPNWLSDTRDQEVAIAAFKRARQIFSEQNINGIVDGGKEFSPGANVTADADILKVITETASSISHAAGTCAMGKAGDSHAVIDSHARVIGVDGVRVVDASSFPFLPPGHPQGTVYALAEKIADEILNGR
ncbi:MAG: hypothetical protein M1828_001697 [Chrysothrix sp. TS-e1954]|nr:MAG: hypothetical protein M1828_001697 [Chrysothrix sp. TS-e1954]